MAYVLDRIRAEGPLQSKDFDNPKCATSSAWWGWKPAKQALEQLFMQGELMVSHRHRFQKVFDLTERVLPMKVNTRIPSHEEFYDHLIEGYLRANGLAKPNEIAYLRSGMAAAVRLRCQTWLENRKLVEIDVAGEPYYAVPDFAEILKKPLSRKKVLILSPFDNVLIQRARARYLFGFDYQIECYKPASKRQYGYFVLPILWGRRFAARMDAKVDRKTGLLLIRHLHIEVVDFQAFIDEFTNALAEFMRFNLATCSKVEKITFGNGAVCNTEQRKWIKSRLNR